MTSHKTTADTSPNYSIFSLLQQIEKKPVQIILLAIAVLLVYGHTLDVPFYLDDFSSIQENPAIYNWQGTVRELWQIYTLRIIGYLSFALNYQLHQFQVTGYHIVNISIHLLAGCAVLGLLHGLMRTPQLAQMRLSPTVQTWLPLTVALIFVLHPLQIQGVTYIVQRLASLAALFYITAMACFIQARLTPENKKRILWLIGCVLFTLLALLTKQNTATLPISLLLLELTFFSGHKKRLLITSAGVLSGLAIIWFLLAFIFHQNPLSLAVLDKLTRETTEISRVSYLATQMNVLWTYLKLFFWSASSHIDYDYPISSGFLYVNENYNVVARIMHSNVLWAALGHLSLLALASYSVRRQPLVGFGIFFYYLAHAVESSLIPIRDIIFEHRTYLPNLGLATLCSWLLWIFLPKKLGEQSAYIIVFILLVALSITTWRHNQMWRDPIALWQHNVTQSPNKSRGWITLGKHLLQEGKPKEGIEALQRSTEVGPLTVETALNLVVAYKMLGEYDRALASIEEALQSPLIARDRAKFLVNQGNIFYEQGHYREAETAYRQALAIYPASINARANLATILGMTGRIEEAKTMYRKVLTIDPNNAHVRGNLQKLEQLKQ